MPIVFLPFDYIVLHILEDFCYQLLFWEVPSKYQGNKANYGDQQDG